MDKLKTLLFNNAGLKIISLIVAIFLWIVSMNINNPEMTQTFIIPVTLKNINHVTDSGMIILNETELTKTQVSVRIKATRNDLISLDTSRLSAYTDFQPLDITNSKNIGKSVPVSIQIDVPNINYEVIDYSPRTLNVVFDELTTKDFPITINEIGKPSKNYEVVGDTILTPEIVTIKGAKSLVDTISYVGTDVDITDATEDVYGTYPIILLDQEGKDITQQFTLSNQSVGVTIPIKMIESILIGTPKYEGHPETNYQVVDVQWTPKYVDVIGNEDVINSITYLELPSVNVTGATSNVTQVFDLNEILAEKGLSVNQGSQKECTVTFIVEEVITKSLDISSKNIDFVNAPKDLTIPEKISVTITGPSTEVLNIDPSAIKGTVDLEGLPEGESDVEVDLVCSNSLVSVKTPVRLRVNNLKNDAATE